MANRRKLSTRIHLIWRRRGQLTRELEGRQTGNALLVASHFIEGAFRDKLVAKLFAVVEQVNSHSKCRRRGRGGQYGHWPYVADAGRAKQKKNNIRDESTLKREWHQFSKF